MSNVKSKSMLSFFVPMKIPTVTQQEHKISTNKKGKPYMYDPPELKTARVKFRDSLIPFVPEIKFTGATRLMVKWLFPITGKHKAGDYKITKPDTDNLIKMLKDVMTDLNFWTDDAIVCSEINEKFYNDITGLYITIQDLDSLKGE